MNFSRERGAMSVSGVNSDIYNQRSFNYTNSSYYSSDLGLSTLSSTTGTVRPIKNTKNYLKDIEQKFNQDPDPRADLQLLSRYKNNNNTNVQYMGNFKIEKELKEDQVPQIFRKMQPSNGEEVIGQRNQIFQGSPIKKSINMSQNLNNQQQQPFKILNYNHELHCQVQEQPKKGFFEKLFSFAESNENKPQKVNKITDYRLQSGTLQNMNDIEQSLICLKNDMANNMNNNNEQFSFTFQMRQQLGIAIDLVNRVLREQSTPILNQILKSIARARHSAKQQLYTSEQLLMETFYENLEFLTQQRILKLKVNHIPTEEQDNEQRQMFYQQASQYVLNSKGYYPTRQQLDYFYQEIQHLNVPHSEWMDFISRRI